MSDEQVVEFVASLSLEQIEKLKAAWGVAQISFTMQACPERWVAHDLATEIVEAIVDAGIAGRDPVSRAELQILIETVIDNAGVVLR